MADCSSTMDTDVKLNDLKFIKQLGGAEDLMFGFGTVTQIRNSQGVIISKINAATIPYDSTNSIKDIVDAIIAKYPL